MPAAISSANPSCFVFLVDQSASMQKPFGGSEANQKKSEGVADAINRWLQNLIIKCAKSEGIRDYYYVSVIGYGAQINSAFKGDLIGRRLVPISQIANHPLRIEKRTKFVDDDSGDLAEQTLKFPVWIEPIANGQTPMCEAIVLAQRILSKWLEEHPDCFPPIVINMTDGAATDGDPRIFATKLTHLASSDGNVLLFNINFSSHQANPIEFPDSDKNLVDKYAKQLFQMSSLLPDYMRKIASQEYNIPVSKTTRGFTFNAEMVALIKFLDIGTRPSNLE
ncbi:MAG: VWA domain-containing protein [Thioploca sp.]|nr:VWA domain-containing protein [Thioploca sp.]